MKYLHKVIDSEGNVISMLFSDIYYSKISMKILADKKNGIYKIFNN